MTLSSSSSFLLLSSLLLCTSSLGGKITSKNILIKNTQQCLNDRSTCNPFQAGDDTCFDKHAMCYKWAETGDCSTTNPAYQYMSSECRLSCELCTPTFSATCKDRHKTCSSWASEGECENNPDYMLEYCAESCQLCSMPKEDSADSITPEMAFGVKQTVEVKAEEPTRKILQEAIDYMQSVVMADPDKYPDSVRTECQNRHDLCAFWAATGECTANPGYMKINCAPLCKSCEQIDVDVRCPLDPNAVDDLGPGDLHRMFERIVDEGGYYQQYKPVIHSRPVLEGHEGIYGRKLEEGQIEGPWVITFDDFLTEEETDRLIELGYQEGYERST